MTRKQRISLIRSLKQQTYGLIPHYKPSQLRIEVEIHTFTATIRARTPYNFVYTFRHVRFDPFTGLIRSYKVDRRE